MPRGWSGFRGRRASGKAGASPNLEKNQVAEGLLPDARGRKRPKGPRRKEHESRPRPDPAKGETPQQRSATRSGIGRGRFFGAQSRGSKRANMQGRTEAAEPHKALHLERFRASASCEDWIVTVTSIIMMCVCVKRVVGGHGLLTVTLEKRVRCV